MLDDRDREVLRAFCDALISPVDLPSGPGALAEANGSALRVVESVERGLAHLPEASKRQIARLLRFMDSPLVSMLWGGSLTRLSRMQVEEAERLLARLSVSRVHVVRRGFEVLKRLILLRAYGAEEAQAQVWEAIGYHEIVTSRGSDVRLSSPEVPRSCETLVIGSGAGGAVVAAQLAKTGQDVVVLEKGTEILPSDMTGIETAAMDRMFEQAGLMTTSDGAISLFAGSCLGGGTTINWSASFRIPDAVRYEWSTEHGVDWIGSKALDEAYRSVEKRTHVGSDDAQHNAQNGVLRRGCRALNIPSSKVPRNTSGCEGEDARACGRCGLGCAHGRKMGAANFS